MNIITVMAMNSINWFGVYSVAQWIRNFANGCPTVSSTIVHDGLIVGDALASALLMQCLS